MKINLTLRDLKRLSRLNAALQRNIYKGNEVTANLIRRNKQEIKDKYDTKS
jgi:hypothetical protein